MRSLPIPLRTATDVQRQLVITVTKRGGGWNIPSWSDPGFILEVVNTHLETSDGNEEAKAFLLSHCQQNYCGTWLISLYVSAWRTELTQLRLERLQQASSQLKQISGDNQARKCAWDDFVRSDPNTWHGIDSFVVFKWWKMKVQPSVRRRLKQLDGILYINLPSEQLANKQLKANIIGQWDIDSPFIAGGDLGTLVSKLDLGFIPIGKVYVTVRGDTKYHGRIVDVQIALASMTVNAIKYGLIKVLLSRGLNATNVFPYPTRSLALLF